MYARMNSAFVKPSQMDEFIAIFEESQQAAHDHADARQGHHGTYLLVDRETNKVISLAFWETRSSHYTCSKGVIPGNARQSTEQLEPRTDTACIRNDGRATTT